MKHIIQPAARDDILRQFRYYLADQDKPEVAKRFIEAVERTIDKLLRTPNAGAPKRFSNESLVGLRSWPVEEFEDVRIYYLAEEHTLRIVRVLHGKRDIRRILEREQWCERWRVRLGRRGCIGTWTQLVLSQCQPDREVFSRRSSRCGWGRFPHKRKPS